MEMNGGVIMDKIVSPNSNKEEYHAFKQGHLKLFFGYAAGSGKTYAMLQAGLVAKKCGIDIVIGYIDTHGYTDMLPLIKELESIDVSNSKPKNELPLDSIIKRKPQLVLIDELAYVNGKGCRHARRYQDIQEILKSGIDVYTTINVENIESLHDVIATITQIQGQLRIPDSIFDEADQVELVDIEPEDLLIRYQRMNATQPYYGIEILRALREMALRRCADRINLLSEKVRSSSQIHFYTDEHILVCLSSSPSNAKIIRTAARLSSAFKGRFTALFVETSEFATLSEVDRERIRSNIRLAQQLGANIETVYGDDVALQISEFARIASISKIVIGRSNTKRHLLIRRTTLVDQLNYYAPNLDIYIIPDRNTPIHERNKTPKKAMIRMIDILKSVAILGASTLVGLLFYHLGFSEANIITIYILSVLFIAMVSEGRIYSVVSSVVSVLVFNYMFTEPRFTFNAYDKGYPVTFLIMLMAAFITSTLVVKIKQHARVSAQVAYRTKILLETNQLLQLGRTQKEIVNVIANQLTKLLNRDIIFYLSENNVLLEPNVYLVPEGKEISVYLNENEKAVANWVFCNNKHAGATTNTLGSAKCLYLSVRIDEIVYGVVGIAIHEYSLDAFENNIVLSILGECALALESEKAIREKAHSELVAKNEKLRANLLRSISHDLRTPLTSISGNAGILLSSAQNLEEIKKKQLYKDIYDDSKWLINLVENLLSITRLEDGTMNIHKNTELLDEVISEALNHVHQKEGRHQIQVKNSEEFLMAKMDVRLIVQVIINIVDNAIKYTPDNTVIEVSSGKENDMVYIEVKDNGQGIPDVSKEKIFDMFYTDNTKIADSRRSLGLGLFLCKSIILAHEGEINVYDNHPKGTIFRFTLPAEEVTLHE